MEHDLHHHELVLLGTLPTLSSLCCMSASPSCAALHGTAWRSVLCHPASLCWSTVWNAAVPGGCAWQKQGGLHVIWDSPLPLV